MLPSCLGLVDCRGESKRELGMELCSRRALWPFLGMVTSLLAQVSNMEIIKAAISTGTNKYVIIVYSDALSTLVFLLCSLIIHRSESPPVNFSILSKLFLLSVFGISAQIFSFVGIQYSTPTLSTAMLNLIPAFTFILAIIFRMEKVHWRSKSGQAKSLGTFVSIAGAFVVTFYKGPSIIPTNSPSVLSLHQVLSPKLNWILGGLFFAAEAFLNSAWYILQAFILREFPAVLIIIFYNFFFNTLLAALFSLIIVTEPSAWKLRFDMGLIAILYSAVIGTGLRISLAAWCLSRTGPLYVSMFKPIAIVFSVVMDMIFLGDPLCLGSLIGAVIIIGGFYAVMWAKFNEENTIKYHGVKFMTSSSEKVPLLQNRIEEMQSRPSA